jgi:UDP-glucose 4-epimerase
LAHHPHAPGYVYNVGSTEEVSIMELAERVKALANSRSAIVTVPYEQAYASPGFEDMQRRVPDTARLQELIGWQATRTLDDILQSVIAYEREQLS